MLNASVDGATVADIAARLHLSESTVRNYLSSAIGKTGTRNRMEAVREARQQGWLCEVRCAFRLGHPYGSYGPGYSRRPAAFSAGSPPRQPQQHQHRAAQQHPHPRPERPARTPPSGPPADVPPPVRAAAIVDITERPSEPPIVREVLTRPETSPASPGAAPDVASEASGVAASPAPSIIRMPGEHDRREVRTVRAHRRLPAEPDRGHQRPEHRHIARARATRMRRGAALEPRTTASELGMSARPASSGV